VFRKRVPGVGSGDRKSSAADGGQSDWRHDQTVSSGRTQSSSTRDINSRGERPQIPWCVVVEDRSLSLDRRDFYLLTYLLNYLLPYYVKPLSTEERLYSL